MVVWGDRVNVYTTTSNGTNTINDASHCSWVCCWGIFVDFGEMAFSDAV
jgi:hypothetical protein